MTKLRDISWMLSEQVEALRQHSIQTAEQVVALAQLTEPCAGLRKILGMSEHEMERFQRRLSTFLPQGADMSPMPEPAGLLGAEPNTDDFESNRSEKPWLRLLRKHGGVPREVCLIADDEEIYDQGRRGTCVAQAYAKALEHMHRIEKGRKKRFSAQWLYYRCKQRDGIPNQSGTFMSTGRQVVLEDGCCEESNWPYNPDPADHEAQGPSPAGADKNALKNRATEFIPVDSSNLKEIQAALAYGVNGKGLPLVCRIDVFPSSFNAITRRDGIWIEPLPGEIARGGHAMVVAGYKKDPETPGGGWWCAINSWGERYASENPTHAGCCWISFANMQKHGRICGVPVFSEKWVKNITTCREKDLVFSPRFTGRFPIGSKTKFPAVLSGVFLGVILSVGLMPERPVHVQTRFKIESVSPEDRLENVDFSETGSWEHVWTKILGLLGKF